MAKRKKQVPAKAEPEAGSEKDKDGLTAKQKRFVEEYLVDSNASAALLRAGYRSKYPNVEGPRLVAKHSIAVAIKKARKKQSKRTEVTADRVVLELARVGFSDVLSYVEVTAEGVATRPSSEWAEDDAKAVQSIGEKLTPFGRQITIKTHDKMKALDSLAKRLGLYEEPPALSVHFSLADLVTSAKAELARQKDEKLQDDSD